MKPHCRRKYDESQPHTLAAWAHERLDKIEPKLDRLMVRVSMGMAGLAVVVFLAANGLLDLSKFNHGGSQASAAEIAK